jgi:hypothetical protein
MLYKRAAKYLHNFGKDEKIANDAMYCECEPDDNPYNKAAR